MPYPHSNLLNNELTGTFAMADSESLQELPWTRRRLRVPREDRTLFVFPSLKEAADRIRTNHLALEQADIDIQGRTLIQLRRNARQQVQAEALRYTSQLTGETVPESKLDHLIVGGHQPTLYHPGVWAKNFVMGFLARQTSGTGLNLVVDNDILSSTRLRVPQGPADHPTVERIPFDTDRRPQPWEDAKILDRQLFEGFADRVSQTMAPWDWKPLLSEMWPDALKQASRSDSLRDALTAARNLQERRWGLQNLELPLSRLCTMEPFLWFASHLLARLPQFREVYNDVLQRFREVNKVRSQTRPVPELTQNDDWLEAPFWVWKQGEERRHKVFAKQLEQEIWLSDGNEVFAQLPLTPEGDACCAVEVLRKLPAQGIRFRTRALTTTLFSRLLLGDLFVHGIGGSKYDEMTDHIIHRFFQLKPPGFLTVSATLWLPFENADDVEPADEIRLRRLFRDLQYNADRHLGKPVSDEAQQLIDEKQQLIAQQQAAQTTGLSRSQRRKRSRENYRRFHRFQSVNQKLTGFVENQKKRVQEELQTTRQRLEVDAILKDREFAYCLFPSEKLRPFMTRILHEGQSGF